MPRSRLIGRATEFDEVEAYLAAHRNVLLIGPAGSGKTAIIRDVYREALLVVDPFAGITTPRAAALRRVLDRGALVIGAARSLERRDMGHVGRVRWRFDRVYLRPLPHRDIRRIIHDTLAAHGAGDLDPDPHWMSEAVSAAAGLPGRAVDLASVVAARWRERRTLVPPRFALVIAWQDNLPQPGHATTSTRRPGDFSL
jgi:hypothetical protein